MDLTTVTTLLKLAVAISIIIRVNKSRTVEQMVRTIMVILAVIAMYVMV